MKKSPLKKVSSENPYPGVFIVLEGIDGCGKTTQALMLKNWLCKKGFDVLLTKEPTSGSPSSKKIRKILNKKEKASPFALQKLFVKDRKWHLEKKVIPALKKNKIVISDRYFFSTIAYGAGVDRLSLKKLESFNKNFLKPDFVFYIDASPKTVIKRITKRGGQKTIFEKQEKLKKVSEVYKKLLKKYKMIKIDGKASIQEICKKIKNMLPLGQFKRS